MIDIEPKVLRIGLSRAADYIRRAMARDRDAEPVRVTVADLTAFAETFADLAGEFAIGRAGLAGRSR